MCNLQGSNINNGLSNLMSSAADCQQSCKLTAGCLFWYDHTVHILIGKAMVLVCNLWLFRTWLSDDYEGSTGFQRSCWLKDNGATTPVSTNGAVSGPKNCGSTSDIRITEIF